MIAQEQAQLKRSKSFVIVKTPLAHSSQNGKDKDIGPSREILQSQ